MTTQNKVNVGIIGCGTISSIYLQAPRTFDLLHIAACADLDLERARSQAARYNVPRVCTVEELLADPEIDIVLNLTIPQVHAQITLATLAAGKMAYSEKPLGVNRTEGKAILELARTHNLRVGCAPDTFLGGGIQTCLKLIHDGLIGKPVAATAFMMGHGHESWHPDPEFYYQIGGGPLYDMGPYYLTALIALLGPVNRVTGVTSISQPERIITSQPKYGTTIKVNTPTHVTGLLNFANGAVGTIITSFDVWGHHLPPIEIHGTEGSLSVPDPNGFDGPVSLRRAQDQEWQTIPLTHGYTHNVRGIGIADMAYASRTGRAHRANGALAFHVLDIMDALHESSQAGHHIELTSMCERPAALHPQHQWEEE